MMMRRGVLVACFVCSTFGAAIGAANGPVTLDFTPLGGVHAANATTALAPADVSFGQYPMSVTGIQNAIHRYDGTSQLDDGPIAYAIVAIRDWESKYPRDPWIARDLLYFQRLYQHAHTDEGIAYARHVAKWLQSDYPGTEFATLSGRELAKAEPPVDTPAEPPKPASAPEKPKAAPAAAAPAAPAAAHVTDVWSRFPPYAVPSSQPDDGSR
jgi:hypothetical protein